MRSAESSAASRSAIHNMPGAMRDEQIEVGAKPERRDGDHHEIEAERGADGAALAEGERDVAPEQGEGRAHRACSLPSASSVRELAS